MPRGTVLDIRADADNTGLHSARSRTSGQAAAVRELRIDCFRSMRHVCQPCGQHAPDRLLWLRNNGYFWPDPIWLFKIGSRASQCADRAHAGLSADRPTSPPGTGRCTTIPVASAPPADIQTDGGEEERRSSCSSSVECTASWPR